MNRICAKRDPAALRLSIVLMLSLLGSVATAHALDAPRDEAVERTPSDSELFPGAGRFSLSAATGVPYVAIAEAAVGVSNGFAIGVLGGLTPWVEAIGVRPRGRIELDPSTRLFIVAPMFYYPKTNGLGNEPWVLAYPSVRVEHDMGALRLHGGLGLIGAACTDSLMTALGGSHEHEEGEMDIGFMGGLWNTAIIGASLPFADGHVLFADASLVMSGVVPAGSDWVGGPPLVVTLGTAWNL